MGALDGKVALITGAGTGIGKGTARLFAEQGAKVVIAARREGPLKETCALDPDNISYVQMDLCDGEQRVNALQTCVDRHGRLDILVSNAGAQLWKTFEETTYDEIDEIYHTNLTSTVKLLKEALPHLKTSSGNIVIVSSTASHYTITPTQKLSVYGASKAGLNQLTRTLAPELGPMGVRINAVCPGLTRGEYADESLADDVDTNNWIASVTALGRAGQPEDIAKAILFFASEQASWVTGQVMDAAGGWQVGPI